MTRPSLPQVARSDNYFDASATARDNRPYENTYTWYLQLQDGAVTNAIAFFDSIEFNDFWTRVDSS